MRFAKDTYLLAKRCLTLSVRNPAFLFMGIITPFLYLSLFVPLLETLGQSHSAFSGNVLNTFVPGMLPYIAFTTGLFTGFGTIDELRSGLIERFRVTPVSRFAILMGYVIRDLCETLFQCLLFTLTALAFGFRASLTGMVFLFFFLLLLAIITSSFGNAMGVITKSEDRFAPITHGITLPTLLLSGTLLPIALAPLWLKAMAYCNPVYHVVEAARSLSQGALFSPEISIALAVLTLLAALTLTWAARVFRNASYSG